MTVSTTKSAKTYTGNGATTVFAYDFEIPTATDVSVYLTLKSTGAITVLNASQYSISGLGSDSGGNVTYPLVGSPLSNLYKITIERVIPYTQPNQVPDQGNLFASVVEQALDRLTMMMQQIQELYARSLRVPMSDDTLNPLVDSAARANTTLIFDANGNPSVGSPPDVTITAPMLPVVTAASLADAITALFTGSNKLGPASILSGSASVDVANTSSGRSTAFNITVAGAVVGDIVLMVTCDGDAISLGGFLIGNVTAADTVTAQFCNLSSSSINPALQNYTARVLDMSSIL